MKTIGLLGGMSWESTAAYYRLLNEAVKTRLGGLHSAKLVLVSVDFAEVEAPMQAGDWDRVGASLAASAKQVQAGGGECLLPQAYPGGECDVLLRADDIVHDDAAPVRAQIERKAFRGSEFLYTLRLASGERVLAHVPSHHDHQLGEWIGIRPQVDHVVTFAREPGPEQARAEPAA